MYIVGYGLNQLQIENIEKKFLVSSKKPNLILPHMATMYICVCVRICMYLSLYMHSHGQ